MDETMLAEMLEEAGLPVTYHHWKKEHPLSPPPLPYLVYLFTDSENFAADNKVCHKINNYHVELYSDKKDVASEQKLEAVFDMHDIYYDKSEVYIESEEMHEVIYEITI